jgi:hypothetical protein
VDPDLGRVLVFGASQGFVTTRITLRGVTILVAHHFTAMPLLKAVALPKVSCHYCKTAIGVTL